MNHTAKALGDRVFTVNRMTNGSLGPVYERVSASQAGLDEKWYQRLVAVTPELVIGPCRNAIPGIDREPWFSIASEFSLQDAGVVDILLVSAGGRLGIVETKLAYNPENRRKVLAQVLEYAVALQDRKFSSLPQLPIGVHLEEVEENIESGEFLLIVAGDRIDTRALRLAGGLAGGHLANPWQLAMVDLNLFKTGPDDFLLVPELRGTVLRQERQVVRVFVHGEQPQAKVKVERMPSGATPPWNADRFFDALNAAGVPGAFAVARRLAELPALHPSTTLTFGSGQTGSMTLKRNGSAVFTIFANGWAEMKTRTYLEAALGATGAELLLGAIAKTFGPAYADSWKQPSPKQVTEHGPAVVQAISQALAIAEGLGLTQG